MKQLVEQFKGPRGEVLIVGRDRNGRVVLVRRANLIVDRARELMADYFGTIFSDPIAEIALGDNGDEFSTPPPPTVGDTALGNEVPTGRKAIGSITRPTTTRTEFEVTYSTVEANDTVNEAGLFAGSVSPASILVARVVFAPFTKTIALTLTITWKITF